MRKTLLLILTVLLIAPMLSGCLYPYYMDDWHGRGYRQNRGYQDGRGYDDRRYDDRRDDYPDYRDRR